MRCRPIFLGFLVACAMVCLHRPVTAGMIQNCGFETGTFSSWFTLGGDDVLSVVDANYTSQMSDGMYQALLTNGVADWNFGSAQSPLLIEQTLGLHPHVSLNDPGTLDKLIANRVNPVNDERRAANGSVIYQDIVGQAGDVITFQWNFLTNEEEPDQPYCDFAFFSLVNKNTNGASPLDPIAFPNAMDDAVLLARNDSPSALAADHLPSLMLSPTGFYLETGYQTTSIVLQTSGEFRLGFGVIAAKDSRFTSGLLVDMNCDPVPEPASFVLLTIGVLGLIPFVSYSRRKLTQCKPMES